MNRPLLWLLMCVMPALATAQDEPLRLAYKGELLSLNHTQLIAREPLPSTLDTPLGSLWKLFVYAWLVDTGAREPAYECRGQSKEEVYCCSAAAGSSVIRRWSNPAGCTLSRRDWALLLAIGARIGRCGGRVVVAGFTNRATGYPGFRDGLAEGVVGAASAGADAPRVA